MENCDFFFVVKFNTSCCYVLKTNTKTIDEFSGGCDEEPMIFFLYFAGSRDSDKSF